MQRAEQLVSVGGAIYIPVLDKKLAAAKKLEKGASGLGAVFIDAALIAGCVQGAIAVKAWTSFGPSLYAADSPPPTTPPFTMPLTLTSRSTGCCRSKRRPITAHTRDV